MTRGLPLPATLQRVATLVEERVPGAMTLVGTLHPDGWVRYEAAPMVPPALVAALDAVDPGSGMGAGLRRLDPSAPPFVSTELAGPVWKEVVPFVEHHGLRACWVRPIGSQQVEGTLLGAVVVFHEEQRAPTPEEANLLDRVANLAAIAVDRHRLEAALEHRALHDPLTGLPNRALFIEMLEHALVQSQRPGNRLFGTLFIMNARSI